MNEKGLTLLEVLAAAAILSIVILSVSYLFTKNYEFSSREGSQDVSVNAARSVIEDLKPALKTGTAVTLLNLSSAGHSLSANDINSLRDNSANNLASFDYNPDASTRLTITIKEYSIPNDKSFVIKDALTPTAKSFTFQINQYFSQIEVDVYNSKLNDHYTLQSYLEKR